jgi:thiol-disulfide isomerase/thioredoxin
MNSSNLYAPCSIPWAAQRKKSLVSGFMRGLFWLCLIAILGASGRSGSCGPAGIRWMRGLSPAVSQATAGRKMIIVDLVADWCGWCRTMEAQTWSDPVVVAESARFVFLQLDIEKDPDGIAMARRFGVHNLPTTLLLTSGGEEFDRMIGFLPARDFLARLNAAIANPRAIGNLRITADREPGNIEARYQLAEKLLKQPNYGEAEKQFSQIVRKDPRNRSGRTDSSLYYLSLCQADRSDMTAAMSSLQRLRKDFPASQATPGSYLLEGQIMFRTGRRAEARTLVLEFLKKYPGHALWASAQNMLAQIDRGK